MGARKLYNPGDELPGGFTSNDGTVAFFNRINAILKPDFTVLDIGAGRGSWFFEETCEYRRSLRALKGKVKEYICTDIDPVVLTNPTSNRNVLMQDNRVPLDDSSIDLIVSDYVLEHISDVQTFKTEAARLLKPGGYLCARTPHRWHYVSLVARLIHNNRHVKMLAFAQPTRRPEDVFPTAYKLNTLGQVKRVFFDWTNNSYLHSSEPRYFFGSRHIYRIVKLLHGIAPPAMSANLFIFLRK